MDAQVQELSDDIGALFDAASRIITVERDGGGIGAIFGDAAVRADVKTLLGEGLQGFAEAKALTGAQVAGLLPCIITGISKVVFAATAKNAPAVPAVAASVNPAAQ